MTDPVSYKPVTLGAMVLKAQKKAADILAGRITAPMTQTQDIFGDRVEISEAARKKISDSRRLDEVLRSYSAFLKSLNLSK